MASERIKALVDDTPFGKRIENYHDFISWARWYPDLMLDMLRPSKGGVRLHLDQRIFLRSFVRFFAMYGDLPRGSSKCIAGDSLIFTDKGIKEIGSFFNYQNDGIETEYPLDVNVVNRNGNLENAVRGIYNGKQECNQIITEDGYSLTATKIHRVLSIRPNGEVEWIESQNLKVGDYVAISRNNDIWGNDNCLHNIESYMNDYLKKLNKLSVSHLYIRDLPNYIDEDLALVYGYLVGDGCLSAGNTILFSNIGDSILDNYKRIMIDKFKVKNIVHRKNSYDYVITDKYLKEYLSKIGLKNNLSYDKEVPFEIFKCSKSVVAAFLRGLFDTDGTVNNATVSFSSVSYKLIHQVQMLLLNYGIISTIKKHNTKSKFGVCYMLSIGSTNINLFMDNIGFGLEYKQSKLKKICDKKRNPNKDIIPFQKEWVYKATHNKSNNTKVDDRFYHIYTGNNNLTYDKLRMLVDKCNPEFETNSHFVDLFKRHYYFSKIEKINHIKTDVYDFYVPDTHSFVSNGFVSHNTYLNVLADTCVAILFPNIGIGVSAQTKENSASLLADKWNEITKHYPLLENELSEKPKFAKNTAIIDFKNGSRIDNIANAQSTKGQRRTRMVIEESALLNNALFEDALAPVVEVPRLTAGKLSVVDPCEMNQQINFLTTAGFKGSDEYLRLCDMVDDMENLKGKIVIGSNWMLPCWYGRGSTKSQILSKKKNMSSLMFNMNYEQVWTGATDSALVNINHLLDCRTLSKPILGNDNEDDEYYIGVDVARSQKTNNNQSSVVVGRVRRNTNKTKILSVEIVNIINIPNILNFSAQAVRIKKIQKQYNAKMVICDGNGLGAGLIDSLLTESIDPLTNESLGCWDTVNDTNEPEIPYSPKILYNLKAQSCQNEVVTTFIDYVDSCRLKLLERRQDNEFTEKEWNDSENKIRPFIETDAFIEEAANLKMKHLNNGGVTIEQVARKVNKDRVSAMMYMLWYIDKFAKDLSIDEEYASSVFVN